MPLYEYKCGKCEAVFEVIQKFVDEPLSTHADCGGAVERLVSKSAFQFKGSGFYITDYTKGKNPTNGKGGSEKSEAKSDTKSESKSDGKSETKTETKTEAKPATTPKPPS